MFYLQLKKKNYPSNLFILSINLNHSLNLKSKDVYFFFFTLDSNNHEFYYTI